MTTFGNWIGGRWVEGRGEAFFSVNPATVDQQVLVVNAADKTQVDDATVAAEEAFWAWSDLDVADRIAALAPLEMIVKRRAHDLATAISREMGKPFRESLAETLSLPGKIRMSITAMERLPDLALPGAPGVCLWEPHGVTAVIGPFNYPIHLVHTHVAPALLAGSTVVVKPSEITPLSGQIYAEIFQELGLPNGVFNLVQGRGDVGAMLAGHRRVRCVAFTGSWAVGRRILEANLDQPDKLLALEMGGKNAAVVFDDADLRQTLHELIVGVCLTSGQRCTATSRLLVHKNVAKPLIDALTLALSSIQPGDPFDDASFMGPLGTHQSLVRLQHTLADAISAGADPILAPQVLPGGAYVTPSMFQVSDGIAETYVHQELFAPHLTVEIIADEQHAVQRLRQSPYGLSLSVFSANHDRFRGLQKRVPSGIYNWNRSTNNASGLLPFGGVGQSGNHRPAGSASALYCAWPKAVLERQVGALDADPRVMNHIGSAMDTLL